jgi:hypothetical protein
MKKIVTLVGFLFVSTGLAFAGVVSEELACGSSLTFSRGVGSAQTISCPGFTNSFGATDLIGATLELYADYQGGTPNQTNEVLLAFTIANPGTVTWTNGSQNIDVLGQYSSSTTLPSTLPVPDLATAGVNFADFASPFTLSVASSVQQGAVDASTATVFVTYTYATTPEPATMTLFGSALLGIGFFARKRTKKN